MINVAPTRGSRTNALIPSRSLEAFRLRKSTTQCRFRCVEVATQSLPEPHIGQRSPIVSENRQAPYDSSERAKYGSIVVGPDAPRRRCAGPIGTRMVRGRVDHGKTIFRRRLPTNQKSTFPSKNGGDDRKAAVDRSAECSRLLHPIVPIATTSQRRCLAAYSCWRPVVAIRKAPHHPPQRLSKASARTGSIMT